MTKNIFVTRELYGLKAMNKPASSTVQNTANRRGKRRILLFLASALFLMAATMPEKADESSFIVVLDAGHGGKDPGNLGTGKIKKTEKDVSLDVTLKVGQYITENYPDVKVVYTRKGDTYPELYKRVEIANDAKADMFISIHCNANDNKGAYGVETFVMGLHKSEESLKNAMRENASIYLEQDHAEHYQGFDPNNPDTYIILSMRENAYLDKSIDLAKNVQDQFRTRVGRKDRGVKQAGYYVISFTNMPSILVELGFLTNSEEEEFLHSEDGKTYMASAIYRAFKEFKEQEDIRRGRKAAEKLAESPSAQGTVKEKPIEKPVEPAAPVEDIVWKDLPKGIRYQIQIVSSPKPLDKKGSEFRGLSRVDEFKQNNVYKYLAGSTNSYKEAKRMQEFLKTKGFKDAFIIAFENGERIELSKAIAQTSE
ncbi:MAG: N-acetylmuramoyl-L-alanine amidase [Flavobacteriales bacterium]|nr:N-acetylmuramoyl-L-alanine amidase [Flavobacteriales bacterium]